MGNRPGADGGRLGIAEGRPGIGEGRPGERGDRLNTPQERRDNLQDRLASRDDFRDRGPEERQDRREDRGDRREEGREDRQDRREEYSENRQDRRDEVREDWQDRYGDFYNRHDDWHHGYWHGNYGNWWNHMWDDHTALMAFGTTMWGLNRAAYGFGYWGYDNPFYTESYPVGGDTVIDYSQPIAVESSYTSAAVSDTSTPVAPSELSTPAPSSDTSTAGMTDFEAAKQSFNRGDYASALASTNKALAVLPGDPIIHEFRALVLFAQGKYQESAAGLYSVLTVGPGWDWTTLSSLYPNVDVYTKQLRALEAYVKQHPDAADARFVLAYHYITTGSKDAAAAQLKKLNKELPQDRVIKELLVMTAGPEALGAAPPPAETAATEAPKITDADLVGDWRAVSEEAKTKFDLELEKDGTFSWTFTEKGKPHNVKGVYALDRNVLALEPNSGGVMLAEVTPPQKGTFNFKLLGAPPGDEGLAFEKSR